MADSPRTLRWIGSSQEDLREFPTDAKRTIGYALFEAQHGRKHEKAKPLLGFGGANVLEVVAQSDGDAYRAVYTVRFKEAIYVLHAFQKKSTRGIKTTKQDVELIKRRLRVAEIEHSKWEQK